MKIILEDNIGGFLYDLGVGKDFLNNTHTKGITIKDLCWRNLLNRRPFGEPLLLVVGADVGKTHREKNTQKAEIMRVPDAICDRNHKTKR